MLLANASEPPAAVPVADVAADTHIAHAAPTVEGTEAPVVIGILPMGAVGVLIGKGRIGFIDGKLQVRISGLEATQLVLIRQVVVADVAIKLDERHLDLFALALGHSVHDLAVGVLYTARGVESFLWGAGTVHAHVTDDHVARCLDALADRAHQLIGERIPLMLDDLLGKLARESGLAQTRAQEVADLADLTCGDKGGVGRGHNFLRHGVILSFLFGKVSCSPQAEGIWRSCHSKKCLTLRRFLLWQDLQVDSKRTGINCTTLQVICQWRCAALSMLHLSRSFLL